MANRNESSRNGKSLKRLGQKSFIKSLREKADIERILEHYSVRNLSKSGSYLNGSCPLPSHNGPDNTPSFGMIIDIGNKRNGNFKCFKCGKGDIFEFLQQIEKCNFQDAISILQSFSSGGDIFHLSVLEREMEELNNTDKKVEKKEDEESNWIPPMRCDPFFIARYLTRHPKRKFSKKGIGSLIERFSIGLGIYRKKTQIIVPITDKLGRWKTFFAQNPFESSEKWYPKGSKIGKYLFGLEHFRGKTREITIAESIWDCLKIIQFGHPCISTFSTSISEEQAELLVENFDIINIAYDIDEGGDLGTGRTIDLLFPALTLYRVFMPDGKDPCLCTKNEYKRAYNRKKLIETENLINL